MDLVKKHGGYRLRNARLLMGLTQRDVMLALGLTSGNRISEWEQGKRIPNTKNLFKLAILYKTLPDQLLYELRQECIISLESKRRLKENIIKNRPP